MTGGEAVPPGGLPWREALGSRLPVGGDIAPPCLDLSESNPIPDLHWGELACRVQFASEVGHPISHFYLRRRQNSGRAGAQDAGWARGCGDTAAAAAGNLAGLRDSPTVTDSQ